ncbi:TPA: replication initiator protein A [Staphylococcus aureus]|nr:replication initiator protein A [Staphylococcus aureus]HCX1311535.1 replication initiator protein A [Staphylococcus aureus]HDJ5699328.1 replication initiator protein A [Staphylococcus aureus]
MPTKFYNVNEEYREKFIQIPKVFFTNPKYTVLSNDAKIAWGILRDRLELSIKNGWIDTKTGNIFFYYKNEDLQTILNCKKDKVIKIKKELIEVELLMQVRQGLNKTNKLYLVKPEVTEVDIYKIQKQENTPDTSDSKEVGKTDFQKSEKSTSRSRENRPQEVGKTESNDTELSNTELSDIELSDMNDMNDNNIKSDEKNTHSNHSHHDSLNYDEEALKFTELQEFPEQSKHYLNNFSYRELKIVKEIILKAKKSFNTEHNTTYMLEDIDYDLVNVLKRFKSKVYTKNESVETMQGYLMKCIKMELEELHSLNMRKKNFKNSSWNIFSQND